MKLGVDNAIQPDRSLRETIDVVVSLTSGGTENPASRPRRAPRSHQEYLKALMLY
ncbi:hypothetical protein [Cryobacterium melibiosiphilum]|uniref:hypothetical protein n=1 Tax=Cryobacterium melibiosiphilum TaxID=995039 RepID=UPI0013147BE6|nr:hypothetical protein [Cryobacterium melibiosiphilum]